MGSKRVRPEQAFCNKNFNSIRICFRLLNVKLMASSWFQRVTCLYEKALIQLNVGWHFCNFKDKMDRDILSPLKWFLVRLAPRFSGWDPSAIAAVIRVFGSKPTMSAYHKCECQILFFIFIFVKCTVLKDQGKALEKTIVKVNIILVLEKLL